jgi:hypothetical protein
MAFKVFKQMGKDVIINIESISFVQMDEVTKINRVYLATHSIEVNESLEEIKVMLGVGSKGSSDFRNMA